MQYRQTRAAIALFLFILAFGFIWLVNGEFTAEFVMVITGRTATVGWSAHLVITAIEIAPALLAPFVVGLPRRIIALLWLFSLPFGVFDVLSSAVGVAPWLSWTGAAGVPAHIQNTFAAEIIGFLPERMIMWLLLVARNVLRGER
ncbi:MAG: hypothetical protein IPP13_18800 [Kouleothrix sp.]|jgi:hypothetical protein|nr:hypothetical protein [Kouleothrix sp.]